MASIAIVESVTLAAEDIVATVVSDAVSEAVASGIQVSVEAGVEAGVTSSVEAGVEGAVDAFVEEEIEASVELGVEEVLEDGLNNLNETLMGYFEPGAELNFGQVEGGETLMGYAEPGAGLEFDLPPELVEEGPIEPGSETLMGDPSVNPATAEGQPQPGSNETLMGDPSADPATAEGQPQSEGQPDSDPPQLGSNTTLMGDPSASGTIKIMTVKKQMKTKHSPVVVSSKISSKSTPDTTSKQINWDEEQSLAKVVGSDLAIKAQNELEDNIAKTCRLILCELIIGVASEKTVFYAALWKSLYKQDKENATLPESYAKLSEESCKNATDILKNASADIAKNILPKQEQSFNDGVKNAFQDAGDSAKHWTKDKGKKIQKVSLIPIYGAVKAATELSTLKKDALSKFHTDAKNNLESFLKHWKPLNEQTVETTVETYLQSDKWKKEQVEWTEKYATGLSIKK